ncbi:molybdenum cofactor biosynthesis protein MoaA [Bacillus pseudomycoides]|uniref:Molybdenum cofactor biosynthesis protein MoaA n=1 Tax=Bacillus pseudomycoides TaxID=64104 RepID=A0AA91V9V3_9BACI|nr:MULTISPECIES: sporulation membrane protein YtrI [Bacillus]PEB51360.1 molybdenum cofactor biosynthesis protein MoaA [Bacillus sp. AFS098217]PED81268.1 molybdenum cofactor biosynthesis protein MoaA [Bacillus pseudomycoides]PEU05747.1 molybdenum cofactor biosynthesis protein MoaA [Bacillus sp. AFS019443]PEU20886.1 molybdenum cofactor biosynthesis protein MoaA [Bacillus sp. AFS014408]PFW59936.1 molybdenum cofactor biosynthesis protein MoaA [Bacillus sp. AFS075034]
MRVPSTSTAKRWYLFLAGAAVGGVLSWFIFLYIYGVFQQEQASTIAEQEQIIKKQEEKLRVLLEDHDKLNEENKQLLTIQEIKIKIENRDKYDLDNLTLENITTSIHNDLQHLLTKNIQSIAKNKELLKKVIENKTYKHYDRTYRFKVDTISFDTVLEISIDIQQKK